MGSALADRLGRAGLATIRTDLLTPPEQYIDEHAARLRFDVGLLAGRLVAALDWLLPRGPELFVTALGTLKHGGVLSAVVAT